MEYANEKKDLITVLVIVSLIVASFVGLKIIDGKTNVMAKIGHTYIDKFVGK